MSLYTPDKNYEMVGALAKERVKFERDAHPVLQSLVPVCFQVRWVNAEEEQYLPYDYVLDFNYENLIIRDVLLVDLSGGLDQDKWNDIFPPQCHWRYGWNMENRKCRRMGRESDCRPIDVYWRLSQTMRSFFACQIHVYLKHPKSRFKINLLPHNSLDVLHGIKTDRDVISISYEDIDKLCNKMFEDRYLLTACDNSEYYQGEVFFRAMLFRMAKRKIVAGNNAQWKNIDWTKIAAQTKSLPLPLSSTYINHIRDRDQLIKGR